MQELKRTTLALVGGYLGEHVEVTKEVLYEHQGVRFRYRPYRNIHREFNRRQMEIYHAKKRS